MVLCLRILKLFKYVVSAWKLHVSLGSNIKCSQLPVTLLLKLNCYVNWKPIEIGWQVLWLHFKYNTSTFNFGIHLQIE
jgi:hypothetical protein